MKLSAFVFAAFFASASAHDDNVGITTQSRLGQKIMSKARQLNNNNNNNYYT